MLLRHTPWIFLLASIAACGGVVIVEDGESGAVEGATDASTTDGSSSNVSETPPPPAEEAWAPHESPHCVDDCGAWIDGCAFEGVCVEPHATCPGIGAKRVQDLVACVCAGCAESCGGSCVMFDTEDAACRACQQTMVKQTCSYEYYDCLGI